MDYQPIENYGIIGDMHTVALVGRNGSIDWLCLPRFDSPSVFAAILDHKKGGQLRIAPDNTAGVTCRQFYWPDTNVLLTRFLSVDGVGEIVDFMPIEEPAAEHGQHPLVRRVRSVRGSMTFRADCRPAFNYAQDRHRVEISPYGASFESPALKLCLATAVPLKDRGDGSVVGEFTLQEGQAAIFLLKAVGPGEEWRSAPTEAEADGLFENTVRFWRRWLSKCTYHGRWREMVHRSALVLKLLTYKPSGAVVAAPTCSLPEHAGGSRNWDYRYTWIRDAAFTLYALMRVGFTEEATSFMQWLDARCHERTEDGSLQVMYGIDGRHELREEALNHLEGYKGSRPVRIGNAAHQQLQLDIYGELMDSVYLYNKYVSPISYELWTELRQLLNWVCDNWQRPDYGVWEIRGEPRHFVYSKVMCWVALDRGLRLADKRSFPADWDRWLKNRDAIYEEVRSRGWSPKRRSFVQYYGAESLDASNLIMPLVFFMSANEPCMLGTLDAIHQPPSRGGLVSSGLVSRYNAREDVDGIEEDEGTFNMCSFWLVEALTRAGRFDRRRLEQAELLFDTMLTNANHLGLFAEETGPCGEALGNFPQAFTHVALISAAYNLDRALGANQGQWPGLPFSTTS